MGRRFAIFTVAVVAGIINAVIIFNVTHKYDYIDEAFSVIGAMSPDTKVIVTGSDQEKELFSAHTTAYEVYKSDSIPDTVQRVGYVITSDHQDTTIFPDDLLPGFRVISEVARGQYSAYELEKL